jgi:hypothetical protein
MKKSEKETSEAARPKLTLQAHSRIGKDSVQVNAAAIPGADWVAIEYDLMPWSASTLDFSLQLVDGTYDVPVTVENGDFENNILAVRILRAQTIPGALNGGAPVVFGAGDELVTQTITYNNVPTGFSPFSPDVQYNTSGGASLLLALEGPPGQYPAIPSAAFQNGDYYFFNVGAQSAAGNGFVAAEKYTSTDGPQSFTFPAPWSYAGPTPAALPTFNFVYSGFSGLSNVSQQVTLQWFPEITTNNLVLMNATANYQNGSTSMTIPDLSSLTGFLVPAASGTTVYWTARVDQGDPFLTNPPSGTVQQAGSTGTYTEP